MLCLNPALSVIRLSKHFNKKAKVVNLHKFFKKTLLKKTFRFYYQTGTTSKKETVFDHLVYMSQNAC